MIKRLTSFIENGGRFRPGEEPRFEEPFYGDYMKHYMSLNYKPGDKVRVHEKIRNTEGRTYEGIIITMDYCLTMLASGRKVHKDKKNKKMIHYQFIESIELIKKDDGSFNLETVDPDEWKRKNTVDSYDSRDEKTESRKKRRLADEKEFHKACPDVEFEKSHIIKVNDGCSIYWPFEYDEISAEIFMVRDEDKVTRIPCETGNPFPNKNSFHAYNYTEKDKYPDLYMHLPDYGFCYEDVNIVCVWKIRTVLSGKDTTIKVVNIHHVGKISPVRDEHNIIFVDMSVSPLLGHGESLFTEPKKADLLANMMNAEMYFLIDTKEDKASLLKYPKEQSDEETNYYVVMAARAMGSFNMQNTPSKEEKHSGEKIFSFLEVFCSIDETPERYYSSAWRNSRKGYEYKALE